MKKGLFILLCLPLLFSTCKKEEDDNLKPIGGLRGSLRQK